MIGFLNLDKPAGITAHDLVARARKLLQIKQIGHSGTLDPMATGVLPLAVGKACRLIRFLPSDKTYLADILLGVSTDTDDVTGNIIAQAPVTASPATIESALLSFPGQIQQLPPLYSAVHHEGKRLYTLARAGQQPEGIQPRSVTIYSIEILSLAPPVVQARITCSAGTYIRAIARDLGLRLGCGGCLQALVREQAGPFKLKAALTLDELGHKIAHNQLTQVLLPPADMLPFLQLEISFDQAEHIRQGKSLDCRAHPELRCREAGSRLSLICGGSLVAIGQVTAGGALHPEVVIGYETKAPGPAAGHRR